MKRRLTHKKSAILTLSATLTMLLTPLSVFALGLGEIKVFSALNQPLEAEITLNSVRSGEMDDLILNLASKEAFERAGVERIYLLSKLKFKPMVKSDGTNVINVTSSDIIREPFLNFLVNVEWPRGNLVREYTVLLDPPSFTRSNSSVSAPTAPDIFPIEETQLADSGGLAPIRRDIIEELPEPEIEPLPEPEELYTEETELPEIEAGEVILEDEFDDVPTQSELEEEFQQELSSLPEDDFVDSERISDAELITDEFVDSSQTGFALAQPDELPSIDLDFDESLSYDEAKTAAIVEQFEAEDGQGFEDSASYESYDPAISNNDTDSLEVQKGDTLWELANKTKSADVSINQAMISILRANPDAFIDNNINSLKTGVVLRIPERADMLSITNSNAIAEAKQQNALWREYRQRLAGAPVIATQSSEPLFEDSSEAEESQVETEAEAEFDLSAFEAEANESIEQELSILAPGAEDEATERVTGIQDGEAGGVVDENNLLIAKESIAAAQLEKAEVEKRLDLKIDEQEQTDTLLEAKNEKLALLQARLKEINSTESDLAAANEELIDDQGEVRDVVGTQIVATDEVESAEPEVALDEMLASQDTSIDLGSNEELSIDDNTDIAEEALDDLAGDTAELAADEIADTEELGLEEEQPATAVTEEPVIDMPLVKKDKYSSFYGFLPEPLKGIVAGLVDSMGPVALAVLALPLLLLFGLFFLYKRIAGAKSSDAVIKVDDEDNEPSLEDFESTVIINQEVIDDEDSSPSLLEKIKGLFKRNKDDNEEEIIDVTHETDADIENEEDEELTGEYEGDLPDSTDAFDPIVNEAAESVEESFEQEEDLSDRTSQFLAVDTNSEELADVEPDSDDTTAEADVYLAYGLFDQAEDLLKDALAANADKPEYNAKLLETYFASGKADEFEALAKTFKENQAKNNGILWTKVVAMGQELLPGNELFAGESSGLKAADFVPSKPVATDIDVGEAENEAEPDFDIGEATDAGTDIDVSQPMMAASETINDFDETIITPNQNLDIDAPADSAEDDIDFSSAELDLDGADSIDLGDDIDDLLEEAELSETLSGAENEDTNLDLEESIEDLAEGLDIDMDSDTDLGLDLDVDTAGSDDVLDLDADLGVSSSDDALDLDAESNVELNDDLDASIEDLLNMVDDQDDDITDLDLDGDHDLDATVDGLTSSLESSLEDTNFDDSGEETLISDDLTEIDFGEDEDIADVDLSADAEMLDIDTDIGDIAVDDEVETKLDLARAYIDMGDSEGAKSSLEEVIEEGSAEQKQEAESLLQKIA